MSKNKSREISRPKVRVNPLFVEKLLGVKKKHNLPASFPELTNSLIPLIEQNEGRIVERFKHKKRPKYTLFGNDFGAIMESIYIMLIIFGFILAALIALRIGTGYFDNATIRSLHAQNTVGNQTLQNWDRIEEGGTMDAMIIGFYFGSHLLMIVLSALIPLNIVFFVFNLLFMIVGVVIAAAFKDFIIPMLATFGTTNIPMTMWLGRHIIALEVAFIAVMIVTMVIANRGRQ